MHSLQKLCLVIFSLIFVHCSSENSVEKTDSMDGKYGWISAGLIPNEKLLSTHKNGLQRITHSRDWIFVMDGNEEKSTKMYLRYDYRVFYSRVGSSKWDTLQFPDGVKPFSLYGNDDGLYVGSFGSGLVWLYEPDQNKWTSVNHFEKKEEDYVNVTAISSLNGRLFASMAGYADTSNEKYSPISFQMLQVSDSEWIDVSPTDFARETDYSSPFYAHKLVEHKGSLYAATYDYGAWRFDGSTKTWHALPSFPQLDLKSSSNYAESMAIYDDCLYVGVWNSIFRLSDDGLLWENVDSTIYYDVSQTGLIPGEDGTAEYGNVVTQSCSNNIPYRNYAMISTGKHLFVAGDPGKPYVYMNFYPFNEEKGWRRLSEGWCSTQGCVASITYDMDVVEDTLYAAGWEGLFKVPLSDMEKMIENERSYPKTR
ncbi:hypothetical protein IKQ19_16480 [Candidatus Saccharibacteria bacterium]|nr:hypothetical protein [Candidatus Saccharibacteria bacterium]